MARSLSTPPRPSGRRGDREREQVAEAPRPPYDRYAEPFQRGLQRRGAGADQDLGRRPEDHGEPARRQGRDPAAHRAHPRQRRARPRQRDHHHRRPGRERHRRAPLLRAHRADREGRDAHRRRRPPHRRRCSSRTPPSGPPRCSPSTSCPGAASTIRPKTLGQKRYVDAIDENTIVFGIGPAGTGKTYLAMAKAVQALQAKQVSRIILTRPGGRGRRAARLPARHAQREDRPLPAAALRRPARHARPRVDPAPDGRRHHRGRPAGLHAGPGAAARRPRC